MSPASRDEARREIARLAGHVGPASCLEDEGALVFVGHIAAPGYGVAYQCPVCDHPFVRVGASFHDARENVFELSPEDVR
jgi:hypothetical protein